MATRHKPGAVVSNAGQVPVDEMTPARHRRPVARLLTPADRDALEAAGQQSLPIDDDETDFSGVAVEPKQDHLQMLRDMADTLREKMRAANDAQAEADRLAADLSRFQLDVIPQAMQLAGVTAFTLDDGSELVVKDELKCSIPKEDFARREQCFMWLAANGHGAIVKQLFEIDVRPLDDAQRDALRTTIRDAAGVDVLVKEDVHASTLKALIKELLEKGIVPPPSFSVHQFKKADLKAAKGRK